MAAALATLLGEMTEGRRVGPDRDDVDGQTLFIEYPTLYSRDDMA